MAKLQDAHCKRCGRLIFAAAPHPEAICLKCKQTQSSESNSGTGKRLQGVVEAAAGSAHFLLRRGDGTVYSCGAGAFGRLGHGDEQGLCAPKPLQKWQRRLSNPLQPTAQPGGGCALLSNVHALRIGAGGLHSVIVGVLPENNTTSLEATSNSTKRQTKFRSVPDWSPSTACSRPTEHKDAQSLCQEAMQCTRQVERPASRACMGLDVVMQTTSTCGCAVADSTEFSAWGAVKSLLTLSKLT